MNTLSAALHDFFKFRTADRKKDSLPFTFHRRRIFILPTRHGLIFFVMLCTLLFGSINHNNNLGFLISFLLGGMSIVSVFHTYRNLAGITLVTARAEPVFAGQPAAFEIILKTPEPARQGIEMYFHSGKKNILDGQPEEPTRVTVYHYTEKRGRLLPDTLNLATTYPLGLFRGWSSILLDIPCLVYPAPLAGPHVAYDSLESTENEGETGGKGVDDFIGLETYQPGDLPQHIAWKSYSRGQGLHTKKFEGQQGKNIMFNPEAMPGKDFEKKLSRICFMILNAESVRKPYGLKMGNLLIEPDLGGSHKRKCLRALALIERG